MYVSVYVGIMLTIRKMAVTPDLVFPFLFNMKVIDNNAI